MTETQVYRCKRPSEAVFLFRQMFGKSRSAFIRGTMAASLGNQEAVLALLILHCQELENTIETDGEVTDDGSIRSLRRAEDRLAATGRVVQVD